MGLRVSCSSPPSRLQLTISAPQSTRNHFREKWNCKRLNIKRSRWWSYLKDGPRSLPVWWMVAVTVLAGADDAGYQDGRRYTSIQVAIPRRDTMTGHQDGRWYTTYKYTSTDTKSGYQDVITSSPTYPQASVRCQDPIKDVRYKDAAL